MRWPMKTATLTALLFAIFLSSVHAGTIAIDPTNGTTALSGGVTVGWEFQVTNVDGIIVDGLGFWDHQSDGFLFSQTFPVGLWDPTTGALLRDTLITSNSKLKPSLHPDGDWRFNSVSPLYLSPGAYRIGARLPDAAANQIVDFSATVQSAPGVSLVRFLRQIGSPSLAMPDIPMNSPDDTPFGPTFSFTSGPLPLSGTVVTPNAYTSVAGPSGVNTLVRGTNNPRTYQMQLSANVLGGLPVGAKITELRFRLDTIFSGFPFPITNINWPDYQVTLAQAFNSVATMSTTFSANMRAPVLVRTGPLSVSANTFAGGSNPNPFASLIVLDTPYVYQGGDLVMFFRHPGSDSTNSAFLDDVTTTTAGYGTDFRALSASTFTATSGTASSLTITEIVFTYSIKGSIFRDSTNVVVVGTGALPGDACHIMTSTNITLPMSQWTPITNIQFDPTGTLLYTNSIDPTAKAQFFRIALP
jgi:hypothetical protein